MASVVHACAPGIGGPEGEDVLDRPPTVGLMSAVAPPLEEIEGYVMVLQIPAGVLLAPLADPLYYFTHALGGDTPGWWIYMDSADFPRNTDCRPRVHLHHPTDHSAVLASFNLDKRTPLRNQLLLAEQKVWCAEDNVVYLQNRSEVNIGLSLVAQEWYRLCNPRHHAELLTRLQSTRLKWQSCSYLAS